MYQIERRSVTKLKSKAQQIANAEMKAKRQQPELTMPLRRQLSSPHNPRSLRLHHRQPNSPHNPDHLKVHHGKHHAQATLLWSAIPWMKPLSRLPQLESQTLYPLPSASLLQA